MQLQLRFSNTKTRIVERPRTHIPVLRKPRSRAQAAAALAPRTHAAAGSNAPSSSTYGTIERRQLGRTDLYVPSICFGKHQRITCNNTHATILSANSCTSTSEQLLPASFVTMGNMLASLPLVLNSTSQLTPVFIRVQQASISQRRLHVVLYPPPCHRHNAVW